MKFLSSFFSLHKKVESFGILAFLIITMISIVYKQTTIFYIIYFFWFSELLCAIVDSFFYKAKSIEVVPQEKKGSIWVRLFLLGIYWVFIIIIFGFIANYDDDAAMTINFKVMGLRNIFFNINLILVIVERVIHNRMNSGKEINLSAFTVNTVVLHISIILGGMLLFFVVKKNEEFFTPGNLWGSIIIVLPFLLLRVFVREKG